MPRVSAAYKQSQRETILDAAEACFARQGVAATRVDDIVAESGLSVGAIYRYFPSRDDIVLAVGDRYRRRDREAIAALHARSLPIRERILESLQYFLARPADRIELEAIARGRSGASHSDWVALVARSYAEAQREGLVRGDVPPEHIARQLLLTCEGLAVLFAVGALDGADALLSSIATVLSNGLAPVDVRNH